jgi:hypothetical protein
LECFEKKESINLGGNMKRALAGLGLLTVLAYGLLGAPLKAETAQAPRRTVVAPQYDAAKEVTLEGTVQSVVSNPSRGMLLGAHLIFATPTGTVDAHLGSFALKGPHALSLIPGQHVKVVGVMTTANHSQVFLARTVEANEQTYSIRNQHGFLITASAAPASQHAAIFDGGAR